MDNPSAAGMCGSENERASGASHPPTPAQARLLAAREAIKRLPYKVMSVDDFMSEKRREAQREL